MPERHAAVVANSAIAPAISRSMAESDNMKTVTLTDFRGDANAERPVEYWLHVYNIAHRSFEVRRPPTFPLITFAACPAGEPYLKVRSFPNTINEKWIDADSGEVRFRGNFGERVVTDMLNPTNTGIDIWAEIRNEELTWIDGGSDNLTVRGLFWTRNDPPTDEELAKVKARLENHYRRLLVQARELAQTEKTRVLIGMEHHLAAEYFHIRESWHTVAELPSLCPNCGEALSAASIAYHRNSMGLLCVIDWKRAVDSGAVKMEEVPEGKRWKK